MASHSSRSPARRMPKQPYRQRTEESLGCWLVDFQGQGLTCARLALLSSNPLAGTDTTLLALAGTGRDRGHAFGFASCERAVGAAEGMNVLVEERMAIPGGSERRYGITNVEYTEFERLGITDEVLRSHLVALLLQSRR